MNEVVSGYIEVNFESDCINRRKRLYHSDEFESLLESSGTDLTNIAELERTLEFVSVQCGNWFSRWICSPANRPDHDARVEFENRELLWSELLQCQYTDLSSWLESITYRHYMQRDRRLLKHVFNLNKSKLRNRVLTGFCYWTSRYLSSLGMNWIANAIFAHSLYPRQSVGRRLACGAASLAIEKSDHMR